ncbi:MAG TPA: serine/threonine-protein kinase, partial [Blastocatellia bacterium]|nr:serine/threonine-protein kinase [Blastocatellia bacterium]
MLCVLGTPHSALHTARSELRLDSDKVIGGSIEIEAEPINVLAENTVISHYRILSRIGVGGMGEVYLAEDSRLGRRVALKLLSQQSREDEDRLRRFEQEARAASALNHPNIITIHEIASEKGSRFIAMEFVEGETVRQKLRREKMSVREAVDVAMQVAGALAAAHRIGILHRDIKPE